MHGPCQNVKKRYVLRISFLNFHTIRFPRIYHRYTYRAKTLVRIDFFYCIIVAQLIYEDHALVISHTRQIDAGLKWEPCTFFYH
jgi:hypothetical protein